MLKINAPNDSFTVEDRAQAIFVRTNINLARAKHSFCNTEFCLANFLEKYIFLIGGAQSKIVSRYDIVNDTWEEMPELNESRGYASACSLGGKIYVIGGYTEDYESINSIENLINPSLTRNETFWKLIQPPNSILSPCHYPVVVPINANQIAILGASDAD